MLSIITVNLNNARGLENTLKSILEQRYRDFEILVIDGGSEEEDLEVIRKYKNDISYWVSEADTGIYHAMNKGIRRSGGDYCFFLNSGDILVDSGTLENVFNPAPEEDIVQGNLIVYENEKFAGRARGFPQLSFYDIYKSKVQHQASFIKKSLFEEIGYFREDFRIVSDFEFFLRSLGLRNASYAYRDIDITIYDNLGFSNQNPDIVAEEEARVYSEYLNPRLVADLNEYGTLRKYRKIVAIPFFRFTLDILRKLLKH